MTTVQHVLTAQAVSDFYVAGTTLKEAFRRLNFGSPYVVPWIAAPPNALPAANDNMDCPFANQQTLAAQGPDGLSFDGFVGDVQMRQDGIWLRRTIPAGGYLESSAGNYKMGTRYYVEEAMIRLDHSQTPKGMGHDADALNRPAIRVNINDIVTPGVPYLRIRQWNVDTQQIDDFDFSDGPLPNGTSAPEYIYLMVKRLYDVGGSGTGSIDAWVAHSGTAGALTQLTQQTFTNQPRSTSGAPELHILGLDSQAISADNWRILWWRSSSHDTDPSPVDDVVPWATPIVYDKITGNSQGDDVNTYIDGGQAGLYWNQFRFFDQFDVFGSSVEVRVHAQDAVPPAGDLSGLFTGAPIIMVPGQDVYLPNPTPQGRYLLLEITTNPGNGAALQGGTSQFNSDICFQIFARDIEWPPAQDQEPIIIALGGEPVAATTFPETLQYPASGSENILSVHMETDSPYLHSWPLHTKGRNTRRLGGTFTKAQMDTIEAFLDARSGDEAFTITLEDATTMDVVMTVETPAISKLGPNVYRIEFEAEEVGI